MWNNLTKRWPVQVQSRNQLPGSFAMAADGEICCLAPWQICSQRWPKEVQRRAIAQPVSALVLQLVTKYLRGTELCGTTGLGGFNGTLGACGDSRACISSYDDR